MEDLKRVERVMGSLSGRFLKGKGPMVMKVIRLYVGWSYVQKLFGVLHFERKKLAKRGGKRLDHLCNNWS